ncbi:MAG: hypothetical protein ACR2K3_10115 [Nocardioides sp.]
MLGFLGLAGQAERPAADGLEQGVLHVLGDQPGDVRRALGPLLGPPAAVHAGILQCVDGCRGGPVARLEVGEHQGPRAEEQ